VIVETKPVQQLDLQTSANKHKANQSQYLSCGLFNNQNLQSRGVRQVNRSPLRWAWNIYCQAGHWNTDTYSRNPLFFSVSKLLVLTTTRTTTFILSARQSKTKRGKDGNL